MTLWYCNLADCGNGDLFRMGFWEQGTSQNGLLFDLGFENDTWITS